MIAKNLYLPNSNYNIAKIFEELKKIIINNGGNIAKYKYAEKTMIYNRSIAEEIRKKEDHLSKAEANNNEQFAEKKAIAIKNIKADLEELQEAANTIQPIETTFTTWCGHHIKFIQDGIYYDFSMDSNPFFSATIHKIKLDNNNCYTGTYYSDSIEEKPFLYDCIYSFNCCNADIKEMAYQMYNFLIAAPTSKLYIDRQKKRVPNIYDGGYHYETIVKKDKKVTQIEIETEE
jgi:hypothetical protein